MNWTLVSSQRPPIGPRLLLTDGKLMLIGKLEIMDPEKVFPFGLWINPEGITGYEWETEFYPEYITHWALAPNLPYESPK